MKITRKNRSGFTLVEIIVVLVILAILAAFVMPSMLNYIEASKETNDLVLANQYQKALFTLLNLRGFKSLPNPNGGTVHIYNDPDNPGKVKYRIGGNFGPPTGSGIALGPPFEAYLQQCVEEYMPSPPPFSSKLGSGKKHSNLGGMIFYICQDSALLTVYYESELLGTDRFARPGGI